MINVKTAKSEITDVIETIEKWIPMFEQGNAPAVLADVMELLDSQQAEIERLKEQQAEIKWLKRKSRWIVNTKKYGEDNYHCLLCGAIVEKDEAGRHYWQRCYHCGAYMELMDGTDRDYDKDGEQE